MKAIAQARIKTDKIRADILADLLRTGSLPMAYAPGRQTRDPKNILRQRMLFAQVQTMVKNRICGVLDRHADVLSQAPQTLHLFGTSEMHQVGQKALPGEDSKLLTPKLELLKFLKEKIAQSSDTVKNLAKGDATARLSQSISGIALFFSALILCEVDDIG